MAKKEEHEDLPLNREVSRNLMRKVDELVLTTRAANILKNNNIIYIGDLVQKSDIDILRLPGLGRKSFKVLEEALDHMGLHLGKETYGRKDATGMLEAWAEPETLEFATNDAENWEIKHYAYMGSHYDGGVHLVKERLTIKFVEVSRIPPDEGYTVPMLNSAEPVYMAKDLTRRQILYPEVTPEASYIDPGRIITFVARQATYKKVVGAVYNIYCSDDGETFRLSHAERVGHIKDADMIAAWHTRDWAANAAVVHERQLKKQDKHQHLKDFLEPLRKEYHKSDHYARILMELKILEALRSWQ